MYRKLSVEERKEKRKIYGNNPIYRMLYTPLWRQRGNDLSPEDVWTEANNLAYELKSTNNQSPTILVQETFDDLCSNYEIFVTEDGEHNRRTSQQAEHSAMMVSLAAFLLLVNVHPEPYGHPYESLCNAIYYTAKQVKGFKDIYEEVRSIEDENEAKGDFIEVADFIEKISVQREPLSSTQEKMISQALIDFVRENKRCSLETMRDNETMLARANDNNAHCIQQALDLLRKQIRTIEDNHGLNVEYENLIFTESYADKVAEIRNIIYPYVMDGPYHIDARRQNQWLAIVEPLRLIPGLLITHNEKRSRKECTNAEICQQLKAFFDKDYPSVDFIKIPKSLTEERKKWKNEGIGIIPEDWKKYCESRMGDRHYKQLARVAFGIHTGLKRLIKR